MKFKNENKFETISLSWLLQQDGGEDSFKVATNLFSSKDKNIGHL